MNDAAKGSTAQYQEGSNQPFWELEYEDFMEVVVYGVRMIAPSCQPYGKSCCEGDGEKKPAGAGDLYDPTRGERSGLIKGLKAKRPFAGNPFQALPWGGKRVVSEDIQFIQD